MILPYYLPIVSGSAFPPRVSLLALSAPGEGQVLGVDGEECDQGEERGLTVTFFAIVFFLTFASSIIYFLEHDAQPESFPSIPATMWWSLLTLTTIGYGDVYPVTTLGKLVGPLIIILGVGMFALLTGILAAGLRRGGPPSKG